MPSARTKSRLLDTYLSTGLTLTGWRNEVHRLAKEKGWHSFQYESEARFIERTLNNIHAELSEIWESYRNGTLHEPCDKASSGRCPLTSLEEELADLVIRALDTAGRLGINIEAAVMVKHKFNQTRPHRHGGKKA